MTLQKQHVDKIVILQEKYKAIKCCLNEKGKRLWAAVEARSYGRGGFSAVCLATGLSSATIAKGLKELQEDSYSKTDRVRAPGGGRKKLSQKYPNLLDALEQLVDPTAKGDPESHLRWTSKSVRHLSESLNAQGFKVSHQTTATLLYDLGYSLQVNQKSLQGSSHEDRDNQFRFINNYVS